MSARQQIVRHASTLAVAVALFATLAPASAFAAGPNVSGTDATVRGDAAEFVGDVVVGSLETAAGATEFAFGIVDLAHH